MIRKRILRVAVSAAALLLSLFAIGSPANAHVRVSADDATQGGYSKLTFRVPTESDTASTTKIDIALPTDTPFAFVSTKAVPGWTVDTTKTKLATPLSVEGFNVNEVVSKVTWTAQGGQGTPPGQFQEFELSVGPLPEGKASVSFPATQTYSDGTVVNWDDPANADGSEPENPAPVLTLASASSTTGHDSTPTTASVSTDDSAARTLGVVGIVVGGLGFIVAFAALVIARRTRSA